jgi:hypothetical protein
MAILRSSHKAGKTKRQAKAFKELISLTHSASAAWARRQYEGGERIHLGTLDQVRLNVLFMALIFLRERRRRVTTEFSKPAYLQSPTSAIE